MKEQKNTNKFIYIVIAIVIIIGAIVCWKKGFNIELFYSNRQEILISNSTELDVNKIEEISKSVLENRKVKVQKQERFGNAVEIIAPSISEEEKQNIINKVNEEYSADISNDTIEIISVANTRIRDILKPYILPSVITFSAIILYFLIMYHKNGTKKVLIKSILIPIAVELLYYSIIAIFRIPFGRVTNGVAIGVYVLTIGYLAIIFQNEKEKLQIKENNKKENE